MFLPGVIAAKSSGPPQQCLFTGGRGPRILLRSNLFLELKRGRIGGVARADEPITAPLVRIELNSAGTNHVTAMVRPALIAANR